MLVLPGSAVEAGGEPVGAPADADLEAAVSDHEAAEEVGVRWLRRLVRRWQLTLGAASREEVLRCDLERAMARYHDLLDENRLLKRSIVDRGGPT